MKSIALLGSTGSVGVTTLDVAARFPDHFRVVAMAAGRNLDLLTEQVVDMIERDGLGPGSAGRSRAPPV